LVVDVKRLTARASENRYVVAPLDQGGDQTGADISATARHDGSETFRDYRSRLDMRLRHVFDGRGNRQII